MVFACFVLFSLFSWDAAMTLARSPRNCLVCSPEVCFCDMTTTCVNLLGARTCSSFSPRLSEAPTCLVNGQKGVMVRYQLMKLWASAPGTAGFSWLNLGHCNSQKQGEHKPAFSKYQMYPKNPDSSHDLTEEWHAWIVQIVQHWPKPSPSAAEES